MYRSRRKTRKIILALMLILLLAGVPGGLIAWALWHDSLDHRLLRAVEKQDRMAVETLLRQGADPNTRQLPKTDLSLVELFKRALHRGQPEKTQEFPTVLLIATRNENLPIGRLLLKAGADPNAADKEKQPPFNVALKHSYDFAERLLDAGANPNVRIVTDYGSWTPLTDISHHFDRDQPEKEPTFSFLRKMIARARI